MEAKQALVVETINKLNQASNAKQRVQHLEELQELLLRNTPALLDTFLAELVPLQMDKSVQVRRKLLEIMAAAVRVRPSPAVLSTAAQCVTALLADEDAQLAREAAQVAHTLLDRGLMMVGGLPQGDPAAAAAWSSVQALQQQLSSKASSLSGSPGGSRSRQLALCLAGIKMAEQAVLQFTSDTTSRLPISQALAAEAAKLIHTLAQLLAAATVKQRAGPVVVAAVKALGCCCLQRPQLLSTTLPPLLTLAQQKVFTVPKPDDQQSGVQASCGAALKDVLVRVYRSNSEASKPWIQQLHQALQLMGADAAAASAHRHLERQAVRSKEALKRKAADQSGREPKVARAGTPGGADCSYGDTPMRTPTPTPMGAPSGGGAGGDLPATLMSLFRPGPGANMQEVLDNAQQVLEVLVKGEQHQAIQVVLGTVAPEVLAELVLRWMDNLPPPATAQQAAAAAAAPQAAPQAGQPSPAASAAAAAAQAGPPAAPGALDQAGLASAGFAQAVQRVLQQSQQQQQQPADRQKQQPSQQAAAGTAGPQQQQQQQQRPPPPPQAPDPRRKAAARPAAQTAAAAAAPPKPALPSPLPMPLRPEQVGAMRTAAVQRILSATRHKPIRNFRELLLSRLASRASDSEGLTDLMLQHVLANYHSNRGHLLLVRWLYALAAAAAGTGGQQQAAGDEPNAAADDKATAAGAGTERGGSRSPSSEAAAAGDGDNAGSKSGADTVMEDAPGLEGIAAGNDTAATDAAAEAAATAMETEATGTAAAADVPGGASPAADAAAGTSREQSSPVAKHAGQGSAQQQDQQQHIDQQQQVEQQGSVQKGIGGQSSSGGGPAASLSGTQYEYVFMAAVHGLKEHLPSTDPAIPRLLQDAPVLPLPAATTFLQELIAGGPDWASTGLHAAYSLFDSRPAARQALLQLLLDAAVSADSTTREKAVGLVVSKLMGWEQHAPAVLEFATAQLLLLLQPAAAAATGVQQQQGQQDGEQPANGMQQTEQQQQQPGESAAADASAAAGAEADGVADQQQQQQQQQQGMDVEAAAQHSMLYLSLCTLRPELLRLLLETYGKAGPEARTAMTRYAPSLALAIGPTQPVLLELIRSPPQGSLDLLLAMITALADHVAPPQPLVAACAAHYKATSSVQLLDPVVISLTKDDVIKLLPQLLIQLPDQRLRLLYRRLALPHAGREPMFVPVDLLVLLHRLEFSEADWSTHKQHIIMAVDRAMRTPEVFPAAVMQTAISRMESLNPTPRLFMRSVNIMATNAAAPLIKWVLELLQRLITKQIWRSKTQWRGFLVCCEKLLDHGSALVLLQLPSSVLEEALKLMPRVVWKKLHDIASADKPPVVVYSQVKKCVDMYYEKWMRAELEHKQAEVAARQAALAAAAAAGGGGGGGGGSAAGAGAGGVAAGAAGAHHQKPGRASSGGGAAAGLSGAKPKSRASSGGGPAAPAAAAAAAAAESGVLAGSAPAAKAAGDNQQHQPQQQQQQQHDEGLQAAGVVGSGAGTQAAGAAAAGSSGQEAGPAPPNHDEDEEDFTLDFEDSD